MDEGSLGKRRPFFRSENGAKNMVIHLLSAIKHYFPDSVHNIRWRLPLTPLDHPFWQHSICSRIKAAEISTFRQISAYRTGCTNLKSVNLVFINLSGSVIQSQLFKLRLWHAEGEVASVFRTLVELSPADLYDEFVLLPNSRPYLPCHNFRRSYAALCDFYDQPFRDEVVWVCCLCSFHCECDVFIQMHCSSFPKFFCRISRKYMLHMDCMYCGWMTSHIYYRSKSQNNL